MNVVDIEWPHILLERKTNFIFKDFVPSFGSFFQIPDLKPFIPIRTLISLILVRYGNHQAFSVKNLYKENLLVLRRLIRAE
jgi:hypothetical protein